MNRHLLASDKTVDDKKGCVASRHKTEAARTADSPLGKLLHLQRTVGNRELQRLLSSGLIQAKLTVSRPDDIYEKEADQVADRVMRMPDPMLQRHKPEEEEEKLQTSPVAGSVTPLLNRQPGEEEEESLQAKTGSDATPTVDTALEGSINNLRGGGQPLSGASRDYFEPRFGSDFSRVRVHTDAGAAGLAQAVNARAFTLGQDVVFGAGQYAPDHDEGKKLLAHELTHVVQQTGTAEDLAQGAPAVQREEANTAVESAVPQSEGPECSRSHGRGQALPLARTSFSGERGFAYVPADGHPGPGGLLVTHNEVTIRISAHWEEQISDPAQRPPDQRNRRADRPQYYLSFNGWVDDCSLGGVGRPASSVQSGNLAIGREHTVTLRNLIPGRYGLEISPSTASPEPNRVLRGQCEVT